MYIDFEGTQADPACLLGVLIDDDFTQYVLDERLHPAGEAHAKAGTGWCSSADLETVSLLLAAQMLMSNRCVVAFSRHDFEVIEAIHPEIHETLLPALRDGKATAKRWARRVHAEYEFAKRPRGGKYTLDQFLSLVGYRVPRIHGPGNTGQRLSYVLSQLERKDGQYERLSPSAKAKWSNLLKHNYHDVHGLRELCIVASKDLAAPR